MSKDYTDPPRKPDWNNLAESVVDTADKVTSALSVVGALVYSGDAGAKGLDDIPFDRPLDDRAPILKRPSKQK